MKSSWSAVSQRSAKRKRKAKSLTYTYIVCTRCTVIIERFIMEHQTVGALVGSWLEWPWPNSRVASQQPQACLHTAQQGSLYIIQHSVLGFTYLIHLCSSSLLRISCWLVLYLPGRPAGRGRNRTEMPQVLCAHADSDPERFRRQMSTSQLTR